MRGMRHDGYLSWGIGKGWGGRWMAAMGTKIYGRNAWGGVDPPQITMTTCDLTAGAPGSATFQQLQRKMRGTPPHPQAATKNWGPATYENF